MATYKGFAETSIAGAPVRRFLLDLDLSVLDPDNAQVVSYLDLDAGTPSPDLAVRITPHSIDADDTFLEIHLEAVDGRPIADAEVRIFFNMDLGPNLDADPNVSPLADPSHWVYVAYRAEPGQTMPLSLDVDLSQTSFTNTVGLLAADDVGITVRCTEVVGPLHVEGGLLEGQVTTSLATTTTYIDGVYDEQPDVAIQGIGVDVPDATLASLSISTPSQPTFPLECFTIGLGTDHRIPAPAAPEVDVNNVVRGAVDAGTHRYKVSYVLANGRETKPSPASAPVTIADPPILQSVDVALPIGPLPPAGDPGVAVVGRRVYRTVASATGDAGEYLLVGEVADNATSSFLDELEDSALVEPPADRLIVSYLAVLNHDLEGTLTVRDAGVENRFEAEITGAPTSARLLKFMARPPEDRPRIRWQADAITEHVEVRLPTLRSGNFVWAEAHVDAVPRAFGAHWFNRGATQSVIEIGRTIRGRALGDGEPIGRAEVLLASYERPWRDAGQAVCVEIVEKWRTPRDLEKARTRVAARDLRYARLDLGALEGEGRHARLDEGVQLDLTLARPGFVPIGQLIRPGRPLRALVHRETFDDDGTRSALHTSIRANELPDECHLDLRNSPADAVGGEYLGVHIIGTVQRLKVLSLEMPSADAPAASADGLRLWLTLPDTGPELDFVRTPAETTLDAVPLVAEVSARNPNGFASNAVDDQPVRHVKALLDAPGRVRIGPAIVALGHVDSGVSATELIDSDTEFAEAWSGGVVRYLSGALSGQSRAITRIASDSSSITSEPFAGAPVGGDAYAIEVASFAGLSFDTDLGGVGITGRVAISKDVDAMLATRATPQVAVRTGPPGLFFGCVQPELRALTARVYGVRAGGVGSDQDGPSALPVLLYPERVNSAFRAGIRERHECFGPGDRRMLAARLEFLPDEVTVRADLSTRESDDMRSQQFEWRANARSGRGVLWMEPALMRGTDAGPRANTPAGIGLVDGQIDGLPRWMRVTVLPSTAVPEREHKPPWDAPGGQPASWRTPGFKAEVSEAARIEFLRLITWSRDHRDELDKIYWSQTIATFLEFAQDPSPTPALTPLWVWLPAEIDPLDEDEPETALGFDITAPNGSADPGLLLTLDLDQYTHVTDREFVRWDEIPTWDLATELQMRDYAGTITVSATEKDGIAFGDMGAGPGEWFLRIIDGRPWIIGFGSAYFGNTGVGSPVILPRIFT